MAGREVTVHVPAEVELCRFDGGLVEEALGNLLRNAAQHSPPSAPIRVEAESRPGGVALRVIDGGPGLPAGDEERVFEKFHRGPGARPGGLGLGLSIVRGFIEAQGGSVRAGSRPDGAPGTLFEILLPAGTKNAETIGE